MYYSSQGVTFKFPPLWRLVWSDIDTASQSIHSTNIHEIDEGRKTSFSPEPVDSRFQSDSFVGKIQSLPSYSSSSFGSLVGLNPNLMRCESSTTIRIPSQLRYVAWLGLKSGIRGFQGSSYSCMWHGHGPITAVTFKVRLVRLVLPGINVFLGYRTCTK